MVFAGFRASLRGLAAALCRGPVRVRSALSPEHAPDGRLFYPHRAQWGRGAVRCRVALFLAYPCGAFKEETLLRHLKYFDKGRSRITFLSVGHRRTANHLPAF